jgi:hypothetical protein
MSLLLTAASRGRFPAHDSVRSRKEDREMAETDHGPSEGRQTEGERRFKIRLKLTDRESGQSRYCTLDEAKTWDWGDPETWRMIGGWQISSFQGLLKILYVKMEKGIKEVEIIEAPRFTMLAGG